MTHSHSLLYRIFRCFARTTYVENFHSADPTKATMKERKRNENIASLSESVYANDRPLQLTNEATPSRHTFETPTVGQTSTACAFMRLCQTRNYSARLGRGLFVSLWSLFFCLPCVRRTSRHRVITHRVVNCRLQFPTRRWSALLQRPLVIHDTVFTFSATNKAMYVHGMKRWREGT